MDKISFRLKIQNSNVTQFHTKRDQKKIKNQKLAKTFKCMGDKNLVLVRKEDFSLWLKWLISAHTKSYFKNKKFDIYKDVASSFLFSQYRFAIYLTLKYVDVFTFSVSPTFSENINLSSWLCYKIVFIYIFHLKSILFFNQTHGNLR